MAWWARACVWHPPYLWPTRTTGPSMASMAAFVYLTSSAYEVSGGCATDTLYPSFLRMLATGSQPEPSAKAPCTRTTFLICCVMTILLCSKDPASHLHPKRAFVVNESRVECPMPAVALAANSSVIDGPSRYP